MGRVSFVQTARGGKLFPLGLLTNLLTDSSL
jgi:hypothetical protein